MPVRRDTFIQNLLLKTSGKNYLDQIGAVQVVLGFPGVFFGAVALPGEEVLDLSIADALVDDVLDDVLFLLGHDDSFTALF